MRNVLNNFLSMQAQNVEALVAWILLGIYAALLLATLLSIFRPGSERGWVGKLGWTVSVLCLPFVGMALYALWSLWAADRSILMQLGVRKKSAKIVVNKPLNSRSSI